MKKIIVISSIVAAIVAICAFLVAGDFKFCPSDYLDD